MELQSSLDFTRSEENRDNGIKRAIDHANAEILDWETMAYNFFVNVFLKHNKGIFQCEDFRAACKGVVPDPPSLRAYGGIITRAKYAGLIIKAGPPKPVKNPNAHLANASVWRSLIAK